MQRRPGLQPMLTPQMASAARNLAAMGSGRDNMLAHINPREAQILMQLGGKGNVNPRTGLPQFDDGGGDGSGGETQTTSSAPGTFVAQPTPSGFTPSTTGYQGAVSADTPFDTALVASYGATPANTAPIDPALANYVSADYAALSSPAGGSPADPFLVASDAGAPDNAAQFLATPGNPDFTINPQGYADFSPAGEAAFNTYTGEQEASVAANAKKNESGLGAIFPEIIGGAVGLTGLAVGGLGLAGLLGGAGDAAVGSADVTGALEDVTSGDVTGAALGGDTAAFDPFAGSTLPDVSAASSADASTALAAGNASADLGADPFAGSTFGSAGSTLSSLGSSPSLSQLAAATPDSLVGDATEAAPAATDASGDISEADALAQGDTFNTAQTLADASADPTLGTSADPYAVGSSVTSNFAGGAGDAFTGAQGINASFLDNLTQGNLTGIGQNIGSVFTGGNTGAGGASFGSKLAADLTDPFKLLGLGATGYGLLHSLSSQSGQVGNVSANEAALNNLATQTGQTGAQLQSYLASGTLPPGLMEQVNQATAAAIQNIKAKYAANGVGPNSTPEAQDIAKIQENVAGTIATIGQQLLTAGTADLQISQGTLTSLLTANTTLNNQTNQAIANLARALSSGGGGGQQFTLTPSNSTTPAQ
jgi:hypothetical protein